MCQISLGTPAINHYFIYIKNRAMKANMLPVASNFISIAKGCKRILQISDSQIVKYQKSKNVNPSLHTNPLHHQHNDSCTSTPIVGMPGQMKDESVRAATLSDFNQHQCHACHLEPFLQYRNNSGP